MSTAAAAEENQIFDRPPPPPLRACFSFAAYAKAVVAYLRAAGVSVDSGLSDAEFSAIESSYGFEFPPDLRSILIEGLPLGAGFPNWRFASPEQLRILLGLPSAGILHEVTADRFWHRSWGPKPQAAAETVAVARAILERAPFLVPFYRNFYIPAAPSDAGNPVFYVRSIEVRLAAFDLADFFRREKVHTGLPSAIGVPAPSWTATAARRVDVWTQLTEETPCDDRVARDADLNRWLEDVIGRRLREGGWSKEEVREMMAAEGPESDGQDGGRFAHWTGLGDQESVTWHVRLMAMELLRGGWSASDVGEAMGTGSTQARAKAGRFEDSGTWLVDPTHINLEF